MSPPKIFFKKNKQKKIQRSQKSPNGGIRGSMVHALRVEVASVLVAVVRSITLGVYVEAMFGAVIASEPAYFPGYRRGAIFLLSTK